MGSKFLNNWNWLGLENQFCKVHLISFQFGRKVNFKRFNFLCMLFREYLMWVTNECVEYYGAVKLFLCILMMMPPCLLSGFYNTVGKSKDAKIDFSKFWTFHIQGPHKDGCHGCQISAVFLVFSSKFATLWSIYKST